MTGKNSVHITLEVDDRGTPVIKTFGDKSFNPCFNGCTSSRTWEGYFEIEVYGFNPCFNGCTSSRCSLLDNGFQL